MVLVHFEITHNPSQAAERMFIGYYESWLAKASSSGHLDQALAELPGSVTIVNLAFMRPDAQYSRHLELSGTGFEFPYNGTILKNSIAKLKQRRPDTKVLVSVGGDAHTNWGGLNPTSIARFVHDFGIDGVDVDFEPSSPGCKQSHGRVICDSNGLLSRSITGLREALPRPAILSLTSISTGAFGEGPWKEARPKGGSYYGMMLDLLRDPRGSEQIDILSIMAYNAGSNYDPLESYDAFRNYFRGPIVIGFTPPPESWGDHSYSDGEVIDVLRAVLKKGAAGGMLFSLRKPTEGVVRTGDNGLAPLVNVIAKALASN
jgi:chitinase